MLKSFKTEIDPSKEQIAKINNTIGVCRYVYNFYLAYNIELHEKGEKFMNGKSFSVWLNNEYLPNNPDKLWIKEVSSKSVKNLSRIGVLLLQNFSNIKVDILNLRKRTNQM